MNALNLNKAEFIKSAASSSQFIRTGMPSVVFAGKSNVGKSSVINRVLNRNNFARTGSTPGKTVHVNYFLIDSRVYFVDLPGYGYAKVSAAEKERWGRLMEEYFSLPDGITLGILIVDSRHKPTADDISMARLFIESGCSFAVVANKTDKLKKSEIDPNLDLIRSTLGLDENIPVIPFSAEKGSGRELLVSEILSKL